MANDNHETYQGADICTYTDTIDTDNSFTVEEIEACVLSAGVVPFADPRILPLGEYNQSDCTGTNVYSPFYKETDPSMILWIDDSAMVPAEDNNHYWYKHIVYVSVNQASNFIATDLQIKKYKNFLTVSSYQQTVDGVTYTLYAPSVVTKYGAENDWNDSVLAPMFLLTAGGTVAVSQKLNTLMPICSWAWAWGEGTLTNSLDIIGAGLGDQRNLMDGTPVTIGDCIWEALDEEPYAISENVPDATFPRVHVGEHFTHIYLGGNPLSLRYGYNNIDDILMECAFCGLMFEYEGVTYKPLAANGVVYGYTDDMTRSSEWDEWEHIGDHTIPVKPPAPPEFPDEDNKDPVNTAGAPFSAGLCHYYALTAGSVLLDHISEALGTWDIENTHKDLYKNLVSCKLIKPPAPIPTTGSAPFTIYGVKPQYEGADITLPVVTGNPDATFGPYTIDRKFYDFRDYAPYTRVSIYLPCCGWCDLPSHVVGKRVSVKYFTDIIAATCKAVVFCNNNIIAEAAGVIGLDIPFVADNVGAKMQAVTAGMIAALGGGIQLGAGIGTMVSTKSGSGAKSALSGASQYLSGYSQMAMAFNENTTEISGKNGDGCNLAGATNIIIKIVRPKKGAYTVSPFTPPGYGHGIGFVSQKQVKVNSVSGLLIADNVDTSGISGATDSERAEIKRVLESGLIVNSPPA